MAQEVRSVQAISGCYHVYNPPPQMENPLVKGKLRDPVHSTVFELLVNYRSHGGIVDCAASIIHLISSLFPNSIDNLQKESAVVAGPKPRLFRSNLVHFEQFLCGAG